VWKDNTLLYLLSIVLGGVTGGVILTWEPVKPGGEMVAQRDTNYYRIRVTMESEDYPFILNLYLDHLLHSTVNTDDPLFIYYKHEEIQLEFLRLARAPGGSPKVLLIGGGGYTLPRATMKLMPDVRMDVVEIDPGVTKVAYDVLGLKKNENLHDVNMDGRQFVAEKAPPGTYDIVIQDAVNDLSVPSHLMTREYNDAVKRALKPAGVYLLTIIDSVEHGKVWRASMATLKQTFAHVHLLASTDPPTADRPADAKAAEEWDGRVAAWAAGRQVYVIYASDWPLDLGVLRATTEAAAPRQLVWPDAKTAILGPAAATVPEVPFYTRLVQPAVLEPFLTREPGVILTDQYAPIDNLMAEVFRRRYQ
jgi:spermidine synthase